MKTHSRATLTSALVLAVVFGSGLIVGAAFDGVSSEAAAAVQPEKTEDRTEERRRPPMYEQVGVSDDQRVVMDSIVVAKRTELRARRAEYDSFVAGLIHETREAIKDVMDDDQRARYEVILAERDAKEAAEDERENEEGGRRE